MTSAVSSTSGRFVPAGRPGSNGSENWHARHRPAVASAAAALLATLLILAGTASAGSPRGPGGPPCESSPAELATTLDEVQRSRTEDNWPRAQASARRVEDLLREGTADEPLVERARCLLGELAEQEADHRLFARLEAIRFSRGRLGRK